MGAIVLLSEGEKGQRTVERNCHAPTSCSGVTRHQAQSSELGAGSGDCSPLTLLSPSGTGWGDGLPYAAAAPMGEHNDHLGKERPLGAGRLPPGTFISCFLCPTAPRSLPGSFLGALGLWTPGWSHFTCLRLNILMDTHPPI